MSENVLGNKKNVAIKKLHFFILSNIVLDNCLKKYIKDGKSYYIPYDFITFYFDECQKQYINDDYLNTFFLCFNNKIVDVDSIINIFCKSKLPNLKTKHVTKNSILSGLQAGDYLVADKYSTKRELTYNLETPELENAVKSLKLTISEVNKTKNIIKTKYLIYIKQKSDKGINVINEKTEDQEIHKHKPLNTNKKAITPPSQGKTERVTKLIIPRLRVLGMYPKSISLSRVDSRYFAYTFTTPANEVRLINIYHLKKVGLNKGFCEKRDQIMKSKTKKSKFDDLF